MAFVEETLFLHYLAEKEKLVTMKHLLAKANAAQIQTLEDLKDTDGRTALELARNNDVKSFLNWAYPRRKDKHESYHLTSPPNLIIVYTTNDRPGAETELWQLEKVLPQFNINVTTLKDPTVGKIRTTISETINKTVEPSALIVIAMMHGKRGYVKAKDNFISIRDLIMQMNAPRLNGTPKVCYEEGFCA